MGWNEIIQILITNANVYNFHGVGSRKIFDTRANSDGRNLFLDIDVDYFMGLQLGALNQGAGLCAYLT